MESKKKKGMAMFLLSVIPAISCIYWWSLIGFSWMKIIRYTLLLYSLPYLAYIDVKEKIVPGKILKWMTGIRMAILVLEVLLYRDIRVEICLSALGGMCMGGGLMFLAYMISRKGIGAGDVKLIAVIGAFVGSTNIYAVLLLSFLIAAAYSVIGLIRRKIKLKDEMPFVPFVSAACLIVMLLGM